ncbi:hypothetical protein COU12_00740 [Candidatus Jorgensenbacteria bacterium CG10_big_fil_rev_8_21_14_0_10_54_38]|uniref:DUF2330 domain-containing protein n=2 Tax=Candidatus Joergenseniibacteriota TaxID=1752739 RepID=A0A2M6WGH8_9BACT|nr:MAG: hypothetical protein COX26_01360 [Candidatus Jorgensenbacteria bacterium CG23_combo_of_CG06-09_8_20_14_all_54_14]PIT91875.1 MAG: hypothetical protein COU12_00740 [Candidatus Jorgensenbacteria bacterium CG10_big_fil_rev_8_21_14_0_10_54_38]
MKKLFTLITLLLIALLAVFSFVPKSVLADGMMIRPDPYSDRWDYSNESNQQAFINYDNGLQKMIISVGLEGENSNGVVWLFPVPSDPNKVAIDVVKILPQLSGEEISKKAKSNLDDTTKFLQMTQIYTIPFVLLSRTLGTAGTNGFGTLGAPEGAGRGVEPDVVVYEHLEKEGITSEIITAKTASGLYDYLKNKGLKIESGSIPVLDNYIGKEYSFVASWISSPEKNISAQNRGVFVTFPTKNIYFPMLPTSVYGSKTVPVTIRVIGHVSPKVFQEIKSYTKTEYYIGSYASFADDLKNFYSGQNQNIKYTKIEINAPSKFLTEDLWIINFSPIKTYYSTFVAKHPAISAILLLIISSLMTGILAGLIAFRALRKNIFKLGLIGLSNCLSIFGLLITTALVGTKEKNESIEPVLTEIKQKGYFWRRKLATILLLADSPFLVIFLFTIPSLIDLFGPGSPYTTAKLISVLVSAALVPVAVLVFSLIIRRIKPEDKNLFEQLKLNNYSSWSFQPKDRTKIIFVPLFSISFLIVSWLLVKLVEFTV